MTERNKGGRPPVQEVKKDRVLSFRVDAQTYADVVERCTKLGYKSLTSYAVDVLTGKGSAKKYTPFNPDVERLFTDVEDALSYAYRLEKRMPKVPETEMELENLIAEINHFKIFVARKAEVLLERVRYEHFNSKKL